MGRVLTVAGALCGALAFSGIVSARGPVSGNVDGSVALSALPAQAQTTYGRVLSGGPFETRKDGSTFGNYERTLPDQPRGHYREYTVATPGARDRGARRIVCGGLPPTRPSACFYTGDHYTTFRRIDAGS